VAHLYRISFALECNLHAAQRRERISVRFLQHARLHKDSREALPHLALAVRRQG
tara:strand:- start:131 stop:292 length:162 start_codon:yes stop_codon:yes gene_type:complete